MTWEDLHPAMFKGSTPRVFATNPDDAESGRVFVWAQARWFERVESATGNGAVEFSPVADAEDELREWLREQGLEMDELDEEFAGTVKDEFTNQISLYPEAEEESLSDREP
ncbi:MAG: hypothetical protein WEB52_11505 [Dehalococcoidia bacterium]